MKRAAPSVCCALHAIQREETVRISVVCVLVKLEREILFVRIDARMAHAVMFYVGDAAVFVSTFMNDG